MPVNVPLKQTLPFNLLLSETNAIMSSTTALIMLCVLASAFVVQSDAAGINRFKRCPTCGPSYGYNGYGYGGSAAAAAASAAASGGNAAAAAAAAAAANGGSAAASAAAAAASNGGYGGYGGYGGCTTCGRK